MTTKNIGFAHDRDLVNGKEEWLTPPPSLVESLGDFDLDPCSPTPDKRPWDTAKNHYSILDDGLNSEWRGRVWCNPPYGKETGKWLAKCAQHKNAVALIFSRTETKQFFENIWGKATAVVFLKGRISFYHVSGKKGGASGAPSMLVTWNDDNAECLRLTVASGKVKGFFIDLRK